MARRRYQRGSLSKDGDRWIARWREDVVLPTGQVKRIRRKEILGTVEELQTKRLAQRALDRRLEPINREEYRPTPKATFAEFAAKWRETVMVHHKPSTQRSESSVIRAQLIPAFGRLSLKDIQPEMLQRWVSQHPAAPKTVRNIVVTLQAMWATAKAWNYAQHDPFAGLRLPAAVKGNTYHFTVEETLAIIDKAEGRWKVFFRILAETGMRPGELAGLRISDVGPRSLKIAQSVWQRKIQTPKSDNAVRSFAVSASLAAEIQRLNSESEPNSFGLVFVTDEQRDTSADTARVRELRSQGLSYSRIAALTGIPKTTCQRAVLRTAQRAEGGQPLSMDNFRQRVLGPILEALGIQPGKRCGLYAFRHMNMTELARLGVPLKTIQKRAGHAIGSDVTMAHYIHAVDSDDVAAADMMGALLSPKGMEAVQ